MPGSEVQGGFRGKPGVHTGNTAGQYTSVAHGQHNRSLSVTTTRLQLPALLPSLVASYLLASSTIMGDKASSSASASVSGAVTECWGYAPLVGAQSLRCHRGVSRCSVGQYICLAGS